MEKRDQDLAEARKAVTIVAVNLQRRLTPMDAAGVLIGAAVGILETHVGPGKGAEFLLLMAAELDTPGPTTPNPTC